MDFAQIQAILGLASGTVALGGQAATTVEAVKKVFSRDGKAEPNEVQKLLNELASQLTVVNVMNVNLSSQLKELANEIDRQNKFEEQKGRYHLVETSQGDLVLKLREDFADGDPIHFICPICLEKDRLFAFVTGHHTADFRSCQNCKHPFRFASNPLPSMRRATGLTA